MEARSSKEPIPAPKEDDVIGGAEKTDEQAPTALYHSLRGGMASLHSLVSFAAGVVLLVVYIQGTLAACASLAGSSGGVDGSTNIYSYYNSFTMPAVLNDVLTNPAQVGAAVAALVDGAIVGYIDVAPTGSNASYAFTSLLCSTIDPSSSKLAQIYDPTFLRPFLESVFTGLNDPWQPDWRVWVDCNFEGITSDDTSVLRAYVVDSNLTFIVSITTGVLNVVRPTQRQFTSATSVMAIKTAFASIHGTPTDGYSRPLQPEGDVAMLLAIHYPFEDTPFVPLTYDQVHPNGSISVTIPSPSSTRLSEPILIMGFDGAYRDAASVFGRYYSFTVKRPTDAVHDLAIVEYLGVPTTKNAWAWGHVVVGVYAVVGIAYTLCCACFVAVHTPTVGRRMPWLWTLPDVARYVTTTAVGHGILSIGACLLDNHWALYEWSDASVKARYQLSSVEMHMVWHARAIFFSWVVLLAFVSARLLRLNVSLPVVLAFVVAGDALFATLNSPPFALCNAASLVYYYTNQQHSLVYSRPHSFNLWTYHDVQAQGLAFFLANEASCYVWSLVGILVSFVVVKLSTLRFNRLRSHPRVQPEPPAPTHFVSNPFDDVVTTFVFENRKASTSGHGLHTSYSRHIVHESQAYASPDLLWDLGYVVVAWTHLFHVDDLPKLIVNCLVQDELFYVFGYTIDGNVLGWELAHLLVEDLHLVNLVYLSLVPLRHEAPQGAARLHHDLYDRFE
ncbi:Aste57867_12651 [Aphanomyces stellatus]|uniref:Aste57867_12651 protein n=1 Tax=Aphanomyces stellatus TaxID=120398 RepID=A0A485KY53_9STRA|nr:hypothetical protein As57867_012605 [Aphanomyces stellatus]VFT89501.1 Aste57867_12651 [Aphanomyces stellatus]